MPNDVLGKIVARIRNQHYLFLIAIVIVVGSLSFFSQEVWLAGGVLGGGLLVVVLN